MRASVSVATVPLLLVWGCSRMLGFDDLEFTPALGIGADASIGDATAAEVGDDRGADMQSEGGLADAAMSSCDGVTCSGQGDCMVVDGGAASCSCHAGYHAEGLSCVVDETCTGVDCGRCGQCAVTGGKATCTCPDGFVFTGTGCVVSPDPCTPNPCDADHACVPEAHCAPLGACVPTCDCSNCGNCGPDNTDGRWDDWQEYCGNLKSSPATMACVRPCPQGDGCLPYNPPICWPMEGCFSL